MSTIEQKVIDARQQNPLIRGADIARELKVSRELVRIYLKKNNLTTRFPTPVYYCSECGIPINRSTSKCRPCRYNSSHIDINCSSCGKNISILRSQFKYRSTIKRYSGAYYCNRECFYGRNKELSDVDKGV